MIRIIKRFFDDINRIANALAFPRDIGVLVELCQDDRDLLANYRRYKPRTKAMQPTEVLDSIGE